VPLGDDAGILDTLIVGGGTVVMSVVDAEAPSAILPQGAIPLSMVRLLVATLEAIREGGALPFVSLVFWDGACFEAVFPFDVAPFIFGRSLSSENMG